MLSKWMRDNLREKLNDKEMIFSHATIMGFDTRTTLLELLDHISEQDTLIDEAESFLRGLTDAFDFSGEYAEELNQLLAKIKTARGDK